MSDFNGVSLVSFTDSTTGCTRVEFMNWKDVGESGRAAPLDEENCLKCVPAVGANKHPIVLRDVGGEIQWRNTGVRVVKARWKRNQMQSLIPDSLMRLQEMLRMSVQADTSTGYTCFVCGREETRTLPLEKAIKCCLCLLPSHRSCCQDIQLSLDQTRAQMAATTGSSGSSIPVLLHPPPSALPATFRWPSLFCSQRNRQGSRGWGWCAWDISQT